MGTRSVELTLDELNEVYALVFTSMRRREEFLQSLQAFDLGTSTHSWLEDNTRQELQRLDALKEKMHHALLS